MAFEDADIKEAGESYDFRHMGDSFEHNTAVGDVLPACVDLSRAAWHRDLLGILAESIWWNALFSVCQPPCLLSNPDDNDIDLLHSDMDQGN